MRLLRLLPLMCSTSNKIIKNIDLPSCRNCIYFTPPLYSEFTSSISRCEKFGTKDIHTDIVTYEFADLSRKDENRCGLQGKYFEEEKNIQFKMFVFYIIKYVPVASLFLLTILCSYYSVKMAN